MEAMLFHNSKQITSWPYNRAVRRKYHYLTVGKISLKSVHKSVFELLHDVLTVSYKQ